MTSNKRFIKEEPITFDDVDLWNTWLLDHLDPQENVQTDYNLRPTESIDLGNNDLLDLLATTTVQQHERQIKKEPVQQILHKKTKVKKEPNASKKLLNKKAQNALLKAQSLNSVRLFETEPIVHIPFKRRANRKSKGTVITPEQITENKRVAKNIEDRRRSLIEFLTQVMASKFPMPSNMNEVNKAGTKHWLLLAMIQILCELKEAAKGYPKLKRFFPEKGEPNLAHLFHATQYHKLPKEKNYVIQINPNVTEENAYKVFGDLLERTQDGSLIVKPENFM